MANAVSTAQPLQTTKLTKVTKGSDSDDIKLRVLPAFVVETLFSILSTGNPEKPKFLNKLAQTGFGRYTCTGRRLAVSYHELRAIRQLDLGSGTT